MDNALETSASIADTHSEVCEAVEALLDLMKRNPLQREIYLQVIEFCETRRALAEAEAMVASCPGFSLTAQTPFRLIANVVDNGGIHWYEVDAAGSVITEERKAGLTDDEADDLVEGFALETSDAGRKACELMAPERRLRDLFDQAPQRLGTYLDIIDLCSEPQSFKAIETLVRNSGAELVSASSGRPLQPSYFVDMLERCGGLVWDKGWKATGRGECAGEADTACHGLLEPPHETRENERRNDDERGDYSPRLHEGRCRCHGGSRGRRSAGAARRDGPGLRR